MALIALHTRDQENPFETANYQHPNDRNEKKPEKKSSCVSFLRDLRLRDLFTHDEIHAMLIMHTPVNSL